MTTALVVAWWLLAAVTLVALGTAVVALRDREGNR